MLDRGKPDSGGGAGAKPVEADPHIRQYACQHDGKVLDRPYEFNKDSIRILRSNDERMPYKRRHKELKTVRHDKYLSVILPMIEFIAHKLDGATDVVLNRPLQWETAHLLLLDIFPGLKFHLFEVFSKMSCNDDRLLLYNFSIVDEKF